MAGAPRTFDADRFLLSALALSSLAGVATALAHAAHAGVDLPNHTYVISVLWRLVRGDEDFAVFYRMALDTPYVLVYLCAIPLVPLVGAVGAVKVVLACAAAAAPWGMARWLRSVGGEPLLGVFGVLLVFAFPYQWGFLSQIAAIPILFLYLAAFEKQGDTPSLRAIAVCSALGLALLFCHGISLGLAVLIVAVRCLFPFRLRSVLSRSAHVLPIALVAGVWLASRRGAWTFFDWPPARVRLIWLFSSPFVPGQDADWARVGAAVLLVGLVLAAPRLGRTPAQWLPLFAALVLYATLPEWIAGTWLVGSRFAAYIHGFLPGVFAPAQDAGRRLRVGVVALGVALGGLVFHNLRLSRFGDELAGLFRLAERAPSGADVRTSLPVGDSDSESFGLAHHRYAGAHVALRNGGLLFEDFSTALQMPLQRSPSVPFPTEFRVLVDRGDPIRATKRARDLNERARLVATDGPWLLFVADERSLLNGELAIVRWSQGWGKPELNRSVIGGPLVVAGTTHATGIGMHANAYFVVRVARRGRLSGAVGVDTQGWPTTHLAFFIRTGSGRTLFETGALSRDDPAVRFSVPVDPAAGLVLEVTAACDCLEGAHADWVDLGFQ